MPAVSGSAGPQDREVALAYEDLKRAAAPDLKRPFGSLRDACERLLPYHVLAEWDPEEVDPGTSMGDAGLKRSLAEKWQAWADLVHSRSLSFVGQTERVIESYNVVLKRRAIGEMAGEEQVQIAQFQLHDEKERLSDLRNHLAQKEKELKEKEDARRLWETVQQAQRMVGQVESLKQEVPSAVGGGGGGGHGTGTSPYLLEDDETEPINNVRKDGVNIGQEEGKKSGLLPVNGQGRSLQEPLNVHIGGGPTEQLAGKTSAERAGGEKELRDVERQRQSAGQTEVASLGRHSANQKVEPEHMESGRAEREEEEEEASDDGFEDEGFEAAWADVALEDTCLQEIDTVQTGLQGKAAGSQYEKLEEEVIEEEVEAGSDRDGDREIDGGGEMDGGQDYRGDDGGEDAEDYDEEQQDGGNRSEEDEEHSADGDDSEEYEGPVKDEEEMEDDDGEADATGNRS